MFCLWQSRMMVHGLYQDPKIVVSSFGIRGVRLCNVCCRVIKIQVSLFAGGKGSLLTLPFRSDIHRFESGGEYLGHWQWRLASTDMYVSFFTASDYLFILICRELLSYLMKYFGDVYPFFLFFLFFLHLFF